MERTTPSSCQVPLALVILILIGAALFCFAGAIALGIGIYYLVDSETAVATPTPTTPSSPGTPGTKTPLATATPTVSTTHRATPYPSVTPFTGGTPFSSSSPFNPAAPSTPSAELDEYGFRTAQIQIGNEPLDVEVAETPQQLAKGLRFRQTLAENAGMLFVFPAPQRVTFWMKVASIPLSIAFVQSDGKIVQIRPMQPYDETPVPSLSNAISYTLLVNQGWFERHGIEAGTVIDGLP
ncbi:MAG: DUF192 domain-containing protein [Chthoniobacterales bacterium]